MLIWFNIRKLNLSINGLKETEKVFDDIQYQVEFLQKQPLGKIGKEGNPL